MIKVDLFTNDGGFVTSVHIPPFQQLPDVIQWGARFFIPRNADQVKPDQIEGIEYREAFAVAAVN